MRRQVCERSLLGMLPRAPSADLSCDARTIPSAIDATATRRLTTLSIVVEGSRVLASVSRESKENDLNQVSET